MPRADRSRDRGNARGVLLLAVSSWSAIGCPVVVVSEETECALKCDAKCVSEQHVCDGLPDCSDGRDEAASLCYPPVVQELVIVDECDDGVDTEWRVWATESNWVWPSATTTFYTAGLGYDTFELIECHASEELCFGAEAGPISWGVGVNGEVGCEGCCWDCGSDLVDLGGLGCE